MDIDTNVPDHGTGVLSPLSAYSKTPTNPSEVGAKDDLPSCDYEREEGEETNKMTKDMTPIRLRVSVAKREDGQSWWRVATYSQW
mmetsp:Transcript_54438/g.81024  ORF Transcript_54438/g.81024 Transcript_54438/m.81024 type:complete len:85 (-) Transcript_54438:2-256(-)